MRKGRIFQQSHGTIILGEDFLRSFQTLRMKLLSPVMSGQARPYVSRVQLRKGRGSPQSSSLASPEDGFMEKGSGCSECKKGLLLHSSTRTRGE